MNIEIELGNTVSTWCGDSYTCYRSHRLTVGRKTKARVIEQWSEDASGNQDIHYYDVEIGDQILFTKKMNAGGGFSTSRTLTKLGKAGDGTLARYGNRDVAFKVATRWLMRGKLTPKQKESFRRFRNAGMTIKESRRLARLTYSQLADEIRHELNRQIKAKKQRALKHIRKEPVHASR